MRPIVVAGGSIGGLAVALFAARAGRDVVLVEADGSGVPSTVGEVWQGWRRRGLPQFRQLHGYQALARSVLAARAPDVLRRLHEAGAHDADLLAARPEARGRRGSERLVQLRCRRPVLEWVLRAAVSAEPTVAIRYGTEVTGLRLAPGCRVAGVTTTGGDLAADLVVDASGRRSRVAGWCADAGVAAPATTTVDTGQAYYTRWFHRSTPFGPSDPMLRVELPFATLLLLPADAGWFSATFLAPVHDRALRAVLMRPDGFVRALRTVPSAPAWVTGADPVGGVLFMGKLANQLRRCAPRGPAGLLPVADAAVCTNPAWGRGIALALAHAAALADLLAESDDPHALTSSLARWTGEHVEPWFHDTVRLDAETNARWAGRRPPSDAVRPFRHADAVRLARSDPDVFVAYLVYRNLLAPPAAFWDEPAVAAAANSAPDGPDAEVDPVLPSRDHVLAAAG